MKALAIIAIGLLLAWLYGRLLSKADGETLMSLNILALVPWVIIAIGTVAALVVLT